MKKIILIFLLLWLANRCFAQDTITAFQAKDYVGKICTVKGKVYYVYISNKEKGRTAFIHFKKPYKECPFKIVIFEKNFAKFPKNLKVTYEKKTVQVTGKISQDENSMPQIIANKASEIIIIN